MEPEKLQQRPAFGVYPPGQKDLLPRHIQKIRNKWARLGVNLPRVWQIIRKGRALYEENDLDAVWRIIRKNRSAMTTKLIARPSKDVKGGYDIFPARTDPLPLQISLSLKKNKGRPAGVAGVVSYFIVRILLHAGLRSKKGPKADRFYWKEVLKLLAYYFPRDKNLTVNDLRSAYYHHLDCDSVPPEWPKIRKILPAGKGD
ncbi:MAG TPA: hypothetical protein DCZ05_01785 [Deltaproteobacteria bacterium]|nr:hypothetical protein [Deltaproteobacteria bacterium]